MYKKDFLISFLTFIILVQLYIIVELIKMAPSLMR